MYKQAHHNQSLIFEELCLILGLSKIQPALSAGDWHEEVQ